MRANRPPIPTTRSKQARYFGPLLLGSSFAPLTIKAPSARRRSRKSAFCGKVKIAPSRRAADDVCPIELGRSGEHIVRVVRCPPDGARVVTQRDKGSLDVT